MPTTLHIIRADLNLESVFTQPEFELFRDTPGLLRRLFTHLQPHAPQLQNMKIERGDDSAGDFHAVCHLYDFRVGIRVYFEKIAVVCLNVLENEVDKFGAAIVNAISAVREHQPTIAFRTHTMSVTMHGALEGRSVKEYLSTFVRNVPTGLGSSTGTGGVMYFGPEEDRILSTVTLDRSITVPEGLFVRPYVVWDASKVEVLALPLRAALFVRQALGAFGLETPSLARPS